MRLCNESKPVLVNKPVVSHVREARESSKDGRLQYSTELNSTLSLVSHPTPLEYYDAKRKQGDILRSSHQHHDDAHEANAHVCEGGLRFTLVGSSQLRGPHTLHTSKMEGARHWHSLRDTIVSYRIPPSPSPSPLCNARASHQLVAHMLSQKNIKHVLSPS